MALGHKKSKYLRCFLFIFFLRLFYFLTHTVKSGTFAIAVCKHNKNCKALYDRIVAKEKSKKLALIAVCNKLLKQAFAVAKSGLPYDENYRSILAKN